MTNITRRPIVSIVAAFTFGLALAACAEGNSDGSGGAATSGSGGSSPTGNGGSGGDGGSGTTSSTKASSTSGSTTTGTAGDGGGGGGTGTCGNTVCDAGETCASCPNDCTENCTAVCGDGSCVAPETCTSCPDDCDECTGVCGDSVCSPGEDTTCPQDCGGGQGSTFAGGGMCPPDPCSAGGSADASCLDPCVLAVCFGNDSCCMGEWTAACAQIAAEDPIAQFVCGC